MFKHKALLFDLAFLLACSFILLFYSGVTLEKILAFLTAVFLTSLCNYTTGILQRVLLLIFTGIACIWPSLGIFTPLLIYGFLQYRTCRMSWIGWIPLLFLLSHTSASLPLISGCITICGLAAYQSYKTQKLAEFSASYYQTQDSMREQANWLRREKQELMEKQDYEIRLATLDERNRIAREIHDNVGHLLTRALLQIKALMVVQKQSETEQDLIAASLTQINDTLTDAMNNIRRSVHDLHEEAIDLYVQLCTLIRQFTFCPVTFHYDMEQPPKEIKYCFLAIVREALNNIARHSNATQAVITLTEHPAFYQLTVSDNGTTVSDAGQFPIPSLSLSSEGIGLANMKERVEALHGIFRIDTGQGFRIFISIPKPKARKED